jgi:hypothetical protein
MKRGSPEHMTKVREGAKLFWEKVARGELPHPTKGKKYPKKKVVQPEPESEKLPPSTANVFVQSGLLTLIAGATMQLDQVGAIPIQQIESVLASPFECDRIEIVLENLIKRSENLLSIISHCRRNHVIQNNETPKQNHSVHLEPVGLPVGPRRANYREPAALQR